MGQQLLGKRASCVVRKHTTSARPLGVNCDLQPPALCEQVPAGKQNRGTVRVPNAPPPAMDLPLLMCIE